MLSVLTLGKPHLPLVLKLVGGEEGDPHYTHMGARDAPAQPAPPLLSLARAVSQGGLHVLQEPQVKTWTTAG